MVKSNQKLPSEDQIRRGFEAIANKNEVANAVKLIKEAIEK